MGGAEQWFQALQKNRVPMEFLRYPRSTHDLSRTGEPWLLVDRLGRLRQWFEHWLGESGKGRVAAREGREPAAISERRSPAADRVGARNVVAGRGRQ
jgi:hypothetical protein